MEMSKEEKVHRAPRTMAEIEWDDAEHRGLKAVYLAGTTWRSVVRMLYPMEHNGRDGIMCEEKLGRVFVPYPSDLTPLPGTKVNLTPEPASLRPEDVPVGEPWQVEVDGEAAIGYRHDPQARLCWTVVLRDDITHDWLHDSDVTLIARLVPETTEQDDEPAFDPAYTYRDRHGDVWGHDEGAWWCFQNGYRTFRTPEDPPAKYAPYTRIEKDE